ncbi:MFS transporter [Stappia stellulata]|uniref:MFS transporter n=1 Tax=Stappia stellulata TaxID=71235 RepID=UPI00040F89D2|nr:MFS transporter [Stappia stellulata]
MARIESGISENLDKVALAVVFLMVAVFGLAQGLTYPLLSFILERQGTPAWLIGANAAMMAIGMIASAPLIPGLSIRFGAARLAVACALALAVLFATIAFWQSLWVWFPARFLLGVAINGLYIASETWVNQMAPDRIRGRLLGLYATALAGGFALGPATLAVTGTQTLTPFLLCIAVAFTCAGLIWSIRHRLPRFTTGDSGSIRKIAPMIPFLMAVTGIAAAFDQAILTLFPVYGLSNGLDEPAIATALAVLIVGNILFQVPIGTLADKWGTGRVMALLCLLTIAGAALLPFLITQRVVLWAMLFVWGSAAYGVYTIALMELGRRFTGAMLISGNACFAVMWGVGGFAGPTISGATIDIAGPHGLPLLLGTVYVALLVATVLRRPPSDAGGRNASGIRAAPARDRIQ